MLLIIFCLLAGWFIFTARKAYGNVKLLDACHDGNEPRVRELLRTNADINAQDEQGLTPLMVAANAGHIRIIKILLEAGANPFLTDNKGFNAETHAIHYGHPGIAVMIASYRISLGGKK